MKRIKKLFKDFMAERQRVKELHIKLEALVDPTFLERALRG